MSVDVELHSFWAGHQEAAIYVQRATFKQVCKAMSCISLASVRSGVRPPNSYFMAPSGLDGSESWSGEFEYPNGWKLSVKEKFLLGSIRERILQDSSVEISEDMIARVCHCALQALVYFHGTLKVPHGDLRAENILLTDEADIRVTDARLRDGVVNQHADAVTLFAHDIWCLGLVAVELASFALPEEEQAEAFEYNAAQAREGRPPRLFNPPDDPWSFEFHNFVRACTKVNAHSRPSSRQLLKLPFIASATDASVLEPLIPQPRQSTSFSRSRFSRAEVDESANTSSYFNNEQKAELYGMHAGLIRKVAVLDTYGRTRELPASRSGFAMLFMIALVTLNTLMSLKWIDY